MARNITNDLQTRTAERDAVLQRIVHQLTADDRVVAAWLYGSLGRNEADALSDIDVRAVVADAHSQSLNDERQAYAARIGSPLLIQEAPQNAPPGGAFLLVMYEGSVGPIQVDWAWQPQSQARLPPDARILFNRGQLVSEIPAEWPTGQNLADELTNRAVFFWMMIQAAGKKIARQQLWAALIILNYVQQTLDGTKWLINYDLGAAPPSPENRRTDPPPNTPAALMTAVRALADEMEALTPLISGLGGRVPTGVIRPAYRFLDLVDELVANP